MKVAGTFLLGMGAGAVLALALKVTAAAIEALDTAEPGAAWSFRNEPWMDFVIAMGENE